MATIGESNQKFQERNHDQARREKKSPAKAGLSMMEICGRDKAYKFWFYPYTPMCVNTVYSKVLHRAL